MRYALRPNMSVYELMQREDEGPFLHKAFEGRLDDDARVAYAAVVEPRDPARAEWLRLELQLHAHATSDPEVLARFIALSRQIGMEYVNVLLREAILNCGKGKDARPRVRFAYACPKRWHTLRPTQDDAVRHCQQCNEMVYYCGDVATAAERARAGQCVAIPKELSDGGVESLVLGRPDPVGMWAERLFPEDEG